MEPFTIWLFRDGIYCKLTGALPLWVKHGLARDEWITWFGFLRECERHLDLAERELA